jgi:oligopeptide transport system substrate-binding protein
MLARPLATLALASLIVAAGGCSSDPPPSPEVVESGAVFRFAQGPEPRSLDPAVLTDTYSGFVAANLFEGLLVWSPSADRLLPGMAAAHQVTDDGLTWTFQLRANARWSNGDPVMAQDFVIAWRRVLNPDTGSDYAPLLFPIEGAEELHGGLTRDATTLGVEAVNDKTLVVELRSPTPYFDAIVAHHVTAPVNPRALKRHGREWTRPGNIVVNGPFNLESWTPGESLVLVRNATYHSAAAVKLARVEALIEEDPHRVLELYESGEIQWTGHAGGLLPREQMAEIITRPDAHLQAQLGTAWYNLNTAVEPLGDPRVRAALSLAVDRAELTQVLGPDGLPTSRFVPGGMLGYDAPDAPEADAEAARALLVDAGFPGGEGFPTMELAVDARSVHEQVAITVAGIWKRELGIEVTVYTRSFGAHSDAVAEGNYQIARGGWQGDYPDPSNFLELLQGDHSFNHTQWSNAGYDGLVEEAAAVEDAATRLRMLSKAEAILLTDSPILPLFHFGSVTLIKPEVQGFVDNALDVHLLRYLSLGS